MLSGAIFRSVPKSASPSVHRFKLTAHSDLLLSTFRHEIKEALLRCLTFFDMELEKRYCAAWHLSISENAHGTQTVNKFL